MHKQIINKKEKRKILAIILCLMLILTMGIPAGATGEIQETDKNTEAEAGETADGNTEESVEADASEADTSEEIIQEEMSDETESDDNTEEKQRSEDEASQEDAGSLDTEDTEEFSSEPSDTAEAMAAAEQSDAEELTAAADLSGTAAPDVVGTVNTSNKWQIVSEEYSGNGQADKKGYDIDKDGSDDIYYQKNVIPTGVENEFRVYMGITKKMTWDELLAESQFWVTTSKKDEYKEGVLTERVVGHSSYIDPGYVSGGRNYEAIVNFTRSGNVVHTYRGWYHGTTPNCSNGTGFIYLKSLGLYLVASCGVNYHEGDNGTGGELTYTIDLDTMTEKKIHFAIDDIVVDSVQDTMGDYITYERIEHCDGENSDSENVLTWTPASNGVEGVQVKEDGGLTGYHYNIHQLVYKIHLKAEQEDFNSCTQNMNSEVGDKESYQTNRQAILNCHIENTSYAGSTEFQVPYVRGLLYDLEFQKIVKDSKISVSGIRFTVNRKQEGSTIAETLEKSAEESTGSDGWVKFHNLPWGVYTLQELAGDSGSFQDDYLDGTEQKQSYELKIGKVINSDGLSQDHGSGHLADQASDVNNMLFLFNGNGIFENTPNQARITIKKIVNKYGEMPGYLQGQSYSITANSTGTKDIYLQPGATDTALTKLENKKKDLKHGQTETYTLMVPKDGGEISLEEIIPVAIQNKIVFEGATVTLNDGSTAAGEVTETEQGCKVKVLPGNDLTITITNVPVGTVKIEKIVDNYQDGLENDAFIIRVSSAGDDGAAVNTEVVLTDEETSGKINITKTTTLNIEEVVPKEYSLSGFSISGGGSLNGSQVTVKPGEDVVVTVHNTYTSKSFFHAADAIRNLFIPTV